MARIDSLWLGTAQCFFIGYDSWSINNGLEIVLIVIDVESTHNSGGWFICLIAPGLRTVKGQGKTTVPHSNFVSS